LLSQDGYYIDPSNITVDVSGISAFNPGSPTTTRITAPAPALSNNKDNLQYSYPLTVPALAASGTIAVSGTATAKTNLAWTGTVPSTITYATFQEPVSGIYKVSPFDTTNVTATVTYTNIPSTHTMTPTSATFAVTNGSAGGAAVASTTGAAIDAGTNFNAVYSITLTSPNVDIGAITTVSGGPVPAVINAFSPSPFDNTGLPAELISNISNVSTELNPSDSWILINGSSAITQLNPETNFEVSLEANNTGAQRSGIITVTNTNARITGLNPVSLIITQFA
jgi:hypothetical protein